MDGVATTAGAAPGTLSKAAKGSSLADSTLDGAAAATVAGAAAAAAGVGNPNMSSRLNVARDTVAGDEAAAGMGGAGAF